MPLLLIQVDITIFFSLSLSLFSILSNKSNQSYYSSSFVNEVCVLVHNRKFSWHYAISAIHYFFRLWSVLYWIVTSNHCKYIYIYKIIHRIVWERASNSIYILLPYCQVRLLGQKKKNGCEVHLSNSLSKRKGYVNRNYHFSFLVMYTHV
jgi:hypothetical protein